MPFIIRYDLITLFKLLLMYVLQDVAEQTGFAQHKIISETLHEVWFGNKTAPGVEFSDYFKPISLATLASILTGVCNIFANC